MNDYEGLKLFGLAIENTTWQDSFDMYGERSPAARWGDPSDYRSYNYFKAKCKICDHFTEVNSSSELAKIDHFKHCAKKHGYIYPENVSVAFKVENPVLQAIIQDSQLYDLPMPGYDDHSRCIKQYKGSIVLCVNHENN